MAKQWFINLRKDLDRGRAKNHGQPIPLVAVRNFGHTWKSSGGRTADWTLTWTPDEHDEYMPDGKPSLTATTRETAEKKFENELKLPPVGGLTLKVTAQKSPGQGAANLQLEEEFITWRRLYYTVNYMNQQCLTLFEAIEAGWRNAYAQAFIDLKRRACFKAKGADEPTTLRQGDLTLSAKHEGELDRAPYHLRILLVNDIAEEKKKTLTCTVTSATNTPDVVVANGKVKVTTGQQAGRFIRDFKVTMLKVRPSGAPVDLAEDHISRPKPDQVLVRLEQAQAQAFQAGKQASLTGTLIGRPLVCQRYECDLTAQHSAADQSVTAGPLKIWQTGGTLHVQADQDFLPSQPMYGFEHGDQHARYPIPFVVQGPKKIEWANLPQLAERLANGPLHLVLSPKLLGDEEQRQLRGQVRGRYSSRTIDHVGYQVTDQGLEVEPESFFPKAQDPLTGAKLAIDQDELDLSAQAGDVQLVEWAADGSSFELKLLHQALQPAKNVLDAGRSVDLELEYQWTESFGGYYLQGADTIVLTCLRVTEDEAAGTTQKRLRQIALHELGHALGLTFAKVTKTDQSDEANDRHYTEHGGQGNHCSFHLDTTGAKYKPLVNQTVCTMFHTVGFLDQMDGTFCDRCLAHLVRTEVKVPK